MTVKGIESQGTKLYYSTEGSPTNFVQVKNVTNIRGLGGGSAPVIDASNLDSTFKEKMMGLPDEGQLACDINLDPDDASHVAMRTARASRARTEFKITFTDSTPATAVFFGYVLTFPIDLAVGQLVRGGLTIEIDGPVTWA